MLSGRRDCRRPELRATARGVEDARAGRVVFVGDPDTRLAEDYLRILRFFRFHARYGIGELLSA